tara:strand:- start:1015 stop:1662 length:648 start_codon:yes stop_codon:yes gene_type:complete
MSEGPIILVSNSQRRIELLRKAGTNPVKVLLDVDEKDIFIAEKNFRDYSRKLALWKLHCYRINKKLKPNELVITADTTVVFNNMVFGKPKNVFEAKQILLKLRGNTHTVTTGVVVLQGNKVFSLTKSTIVKFRQYSTQEIDDYIKTGLPFDRAGSYGIQDKPFLPVDSYVGCYLNIVGLPLCEIQSIFSCLSRKINTLECSITCRPELSAKELEN